MNTILRFIPGAAAAQTQLQIWRDQLRDLRALYPFVVPYLLWVSYATALTWSVWRRNPAVL